MQRLNTLRFALAGGIYDAGCVAAATVCALLGVPGFKPFTDLLTQFLRLLWIFRCYQYAGELHETHGRKRPLSYLGVTSTAQCHE
jgi:hypothetical protein